jgi:cbb3-type cytochrome oxidase subunit 3
MGTLLAFATVCIGVLLVVVVWGLFRLQRKLAAR